MNSEGYRFLLSAILPGETDPDSGRMGTSDVHVLREAIRIARANGLYLPLGRRLLESGRSLAGHDQALWNTEVEQHANLLRTIRFLNEASEGGGIDYLVIKDCPTIDHVPRDVDVLVHGEDRDAFLRLLQRRGLELEYASAAETSLRGPGMLRIDVYSEIRYLGREFIREEFLWGSERVRSTAGVDHPGLTAEATYLLNLIHGFLGRGSITLLDFLDFVRLEAEFRDPHAMRREASGCGWARLFDRLVEDLTEKRHTIMDEGGMFPFPCRYPRAFVIDSLGEIDALSLGPRERLAFRASLLLDDVVFHLENAGIANGLRKLRFAPRLGNTLGHGLRHIRGDSKDPARGRKVDP